MHRFEFAHAGLAVAIVLAFLAPLGTPPSTSAQGSREDAGQVFAIDRMSTPRAVHTATLLLNGEVLIAGGCVINGCDLGQASATAELYDPASGRFRPTGKMLQERDGHQALRLPTGKVLIAGGWSRTGLIRDAELYDPETKIFAATGSMREPRGASVAVLLSSGKVLFAGGFDGRHNLASAELYDPQTGQFAPTGNMTTARSAAAVASLTDGRVLVVGGQGRTDTDILTSAELYDPVTGSFSSTGDMSVPRLKHAAVSLLNGQVLVVGGSDTPENRASYASAELYDAARGVFMPTEDMATKRFKLPDAVAQLGNGMALIAGSGSQPEVFDPGVGAFRPVSGSLGAAWSFATATLLRNGDVLITGGYNATIEITADAWLYHPEV